jgi:hypothetical protein
MQAPHRRAANYVGMARLISAVGEVHRRYSGVLISQGEPVKRRKKTPTPRKTTSSLVYGRPKLDAKGSLTDEAIEEFARELFSAMKAEWEEEKGRRVPTDQVPEP